MMEGAFRINQDLVFRFCIDVIIGLPISTSNSRFGFGTYDNFLTRSLIAPWIFLTKNKERKEFLFTNLNEICINCFCDRSFQCITLRRAPGQHLRLTYCSVIDIKWLLVSKITRPLACLPICGSQLLITGLSLKWAAAISLRWRALVISPGWRDWALSLW